MMTTVLRTGLAACLLAAILLPSLGVQAEPLQQDTGEAILEELRAIRGLLGRIEKSGGLVRQAPRPTATATVSVKDRPVQGAADAPLTLVEFTDYECPFCARFFNQTYAQLKATYIDTGKLRLVIKDKPLPMHRNARKAAQASHCAGEQDAYWSMHEKLFDNAKQLGPQLLPGYAADLGFDVADFEACMASDRHLKHIASDSMEAQRRGITGTPSFVLGVTNGDTVEGAIIRGAVPFERFQSQIEALLAKRANE